MLKFYIESIIQHPLTGEADRKIIECIANAPELEKTLFDDKRMKFDDRHIIDVARIEKGEPK